MGGGSGVGWQGTHNSQEELTHFKEDRRKMTRGEIISQTGCSINNLVGKGELHSRRFKGRTQSVALWAQGPIWKIKILHASHNMEDILHVSLVTGLHKERADPIC